jgi:hypothetical protein
VTADTKEKQRKAVTLNGDQLRVPKTLSELMT